MGDCGSEPRDWLLSVSHQCVTTSVPLRHYNAILRQGASGGGWWPRNCEGTGEKGFPEISLEPKSDFEISASTWPSGKAGACSSRSKI